MRKWFGAIVVSIGLLTAGALLLVHRLTEPSTPGSVRGSSAPAPVGESPATPSWFEWGKGEAGPTASGEAAPASAGPWDSTGVGQGPDGSTGLQDASPAAQPGVPAEEEDSRSAIRAQRRARQVEKLKKRNQSPHRSASDSER